MAHGGGMPWLPGTYDPELNLYYFGTGNPQPGARRPEPRRATTSGRARSSRSIPDTGKMVWYYQATPHDTHDWDAAQTPVLIDGVIDGKPRKLIAQANRNGHFFLLDRTNGKHVLTTTHHRLGELDEGTQREGPADSESRPRTRACPGRSCSPDTNGATNWPPPSFSPDTGLFYVGITQSFSVFYLTDTDERPQGWARRRARRRQPRQRAQGDRLQDRQGAAGAVRWR